MKTTADLIFGKDQLTAAEEKQVADWLAGEPATRIVCMVIQPEPLPHPVRFLAQEELQKMPSRCGRTSPRRAVLSP